MRPERSIILMLFRKSIPYLIAFLILFINLLVSCDEEPVNFGRSLIPDSIHAFIDTTELIHSFTIKGDSLVTGNMNVQLLGHKTDSMFGISKSELVTEITLFEQESFNFGTNPRKDSVIFTLSFAGYKGDPQSLVEIFLYEYTDKIESDSNVYSNTEISDKYDPLPLGSGYIDFVDSVVKVNITNENFIQKIFAADVAIFEDNEKLTQYIHGLYLHPENHSEEGAIVFINFSLNPGKLSVYYSNDVNTSLSYHFSVGAYSSRFSIYHHDYQGFPICHFISGGQENDSLVFIQSMAGANGIIRLPELKSWLDSSPVAINHAKLILKPADKLITGLSKDDYPQLLNMYLLHSSMEYRYVFDNMINENTYGGEYNSITDSYEFNIGYHLQAYLSGMIDNFDFILIPGKATQEYKQVILCGAKFSGKDRIKMEIIFTPL